ncbi:MAG: T9SS type A sorting domain-containing protein [Bacteroidetes bacterium]|nr:T9SS type A sorting domain-containing protein [Bacteroidota bacterium]
MILSILLVSWISCFAQSSFPYSQEWGTYVGGAGTNIKEISNNIDGGILFDSNDKVVVGGTVRPVSGFNLNYYNQFVVSSNSNPFIMGNNYNIFTSEFSTGGQLTASAYWDIYNTGEHLMHIDKLGNRYVVKNITGLVSNLSTSNVWLSAFTNATFSQTSAIYTRVLTKYNASGNAIWTTYLPNPDDGYLTGLVTDATGNIYLYGSTRSDIQEIGTSGVYQEHLINYISGGNNWYNSYIVKLNSSGQKIWGTYFPSSITRLRIHDDGGLYFIAQYSANCPVVPTTAGTFQPSSPARYMIMKFDTSTGQRVWGTFYGHQNLSYAVLEDIREIRVNASGIYVLGYVMPNNSDDGYYATPGCYQPQMKGEGDLHLSKFDTSGNRIWATYFGGNGDEDYWSATTMGLSDNSIAIASINYGSENMATPGAFLTSPANPPSKGNMYFAEFRPDSGILMYCSYFGGAEIIPGSFINTSFDNAGNLYLFGYTTAMTGIATPNGYYNTTLQPAPGGNTFGFLTKFTKHELAVNDTKNVSDLILYDNPNNGIFTLFGSTLEKKNCRLQILDSAGRLVSNKKLEKNKTQKFDMKGILVSGVYYLYIKDEKETTLKTFKMTVK